MLHPGKTSCTCVLERLLQNQKLPRNVTRVASGVGRRQHPSRKYSGLGNCRAGGKGNQWSNVPSQRQTGPFLSTQPGFLESCSFHSIPTRQPGARLWPRWKPAGSSASLCIPRSGKCHRQDTKNRHFMAETLVSPPCLQPGCFCSPKQTSPKLPLCFCCISVLLL